MSPKIGTFFGSTSKQDKTISPLTQYIVKNNEEVGMCVIETLLTQFEEIYTLADNL